MRSGVPARRLPALARGLALALAALALAALAGEAIVRLTGALDRGPVPRRLVEPTGAAEPPYRLRPGERLRVLGREVRVSSLGLRGAEVAPRPPPGSRRVLVLGDSVAFGWGLDEAESFPARLAEALRARGIAAEVLNAGVPGYSLASEAALYRELAPALAPDAVVLAVSLNDFTPTPSLSPLGVLVSFDARPAPGWLAHSELYAFVRWRMGALGAALAEGDDPGRSERAALFLRRMAIASRERFYAEPGGPGWEPIERGLRELAERAGAALLVVIFPEEDQVLAPGEARRPQLRFAERCETLALRCLDLADSFLRAAGAGPLFRDLQHPSARGSAVAAEATADVLAPTLAELGTGSASTGRLAGVR
jgi:lysophospholipase L1-like esterase